MFRVDNAEEIQIAFDLASKGKLENKKRPGALGGNFAGMFTSLRVVGKPSRKIFLKKLNLISRPWDKKPIWWETGSILYWERAGNFEIRWLS